MPISALGPLLLLAGLIENQHRVGAGQVADHVPADRVLDGVLVPDSVCPAYLLRSLIRVADVRWAVEIALTVPEIRRLLTVF
jgi:hypothetical protein